MKIIEPSIEVLDKVNGEEILKKIEFCGRVCYKSENKITENSAADFVTRLIKNGHESVLEHASITVKIICDRGVSHELVRHRLASYSQESTRYVKYDNLEFVEPHGITEKQGTVLGYVMNEAEKNYKFMLARGASPQVARAVLPTCLKTELIMTANLREWRHILKLRTSKAAHPDMQVVANMILSKFRELVPVVFDDILSEA